VRESEVKNRGNMAYGDPFASDDEGAPQQQQKQAADTVPSAEEILANGQTTGGLDKDNAEVEKPPDDGSKFKMFLGILRK
jgi:hypothetical protein